MDDLLRQYCQSLQILKLQTDMMTCND